MFNIATENKLMEYILKRMQDYQYDPRRLLALILLAIKTYLTESIREAVDRASTKPEMLFIEADSYYDRKITTIQLERLFNSIRVHTSNSTMKFLIEIFNPKGNGVIDFDTYCSISGL
eukprot:TRINITY_DN15776_c0_g1_i1.p1 TRINITY_DN15776_c0_g1~~TRINITY_DN15776_c0_g1_i1.p1  ORF type:complete len:118 (-),score=2.19 TRINITY_DN15776_c0_g1_i1:88-441(-)